MVEDRLWNKLSETRGIEKIFVRMSSVRFSKKFT